MSKMLINAYKYGFDQIKHIYSEDGVVKRETVNFKPFLGVYATKEEKTSWTDMYGKKVKVEVFNSISDMYKWKKENSSLDILGDIDVVDMFVATQYRHDIELDRTGMKIFNIDIEVFVEEGGGFPTPELAKFPINAITINEMVTNTYVSFFIGDYKVQNDSETFIKCDCESDLLEKFLDYWNRENPQIITGWNIEIFDIPYLVNRINRVCGPEEVKRLSTDRKITSHKKVDKKTSREYTTFSLQGHIIWDYIELYKKYTQETREMYSLDFIASVELDQKKVEYLDEYDNLNDLYLKDPQKFFEYNIKDTNLVYELDYKLDYINVAMSIMHKSKCKPDKIFGTIAPWDCIIYNKLLSRKILCPPNRNNHKQTFIGGYVGKSKPDLYDWTMVFDIVSSYPNQIRSYNLSPETAIPDEKLPDELRDIKNRYTGIDICADLEKTKDIGETLKKYDVAFTSNGYFFDISKEGIIPSIFTELFQLRKYYKNQLKEHRKAGRDREAKIADLYQYTIKILLNSGYGGIANNFSRYYDIRIAEAVTSNGQIACKGAIKTLQDKLGLEIYYADTDSNFISLKNIIDQRFKGKDVDNQTKVDFLLKYAEKCIEPALKEFFEQLAINMNMRELTIAMEPECIADVTLFKAPKMYVMQKLWDEGTFMVEKPKKKIRGIEIVRSSTPKVVREKLRECIDAIFATKSNAKLIDMIEDFRKEFKKLPIESISFPRSVKMGEYTRSSKGLPIGVNAALSYNDYLLKLKLNKKYVSVANGDKIKFCYIKEPNHVRSHVIGFINKMPVEMKDTFEINYDMQYRKAFLDPIESILDVIGWKSEEKNSLEEFFS